MGTDIIAKYFPDLSGRQKEQFDAIGMLYPEWNEKINVISRRDIDNLYVHHILHSLSIAKFLQPKAGTEFMDLGTGGGFPGIPLAILWPECRFHLIDRIAKKIKVASEISSAIGLDNVTFQHGVSGECHRKFDFIVSRAVMRLDDLVRITRRNVSSDCRNMHPNGLICLKGGDIDEESRGIQLPVVTFPVSEFFPEEEFFSSKELIYVPYKSVKR